MIKLKPNFEGVVKAIIFNPNKLNDYKDYNVRTNILNHITIYDNLFQNELYKGKWIPMDFGNIIYKYYLINQIKIKDTWCQNNNTHIDFIGSYVFDIVDIIKNNETCDINEHIVDN